MLRVTGYYEYTAKSGDTFDMLALDMYNDETLMHYIVKFNPDYADVVIFEGGEKLNLPVVENPEKSESIAPWIQKENKQIAETAEWNTIE